MTWWPRGVRLLLMLGWEAGPTLFLLHALLSASGFITPLVFAFGLRPLVDGAVSHQSAELTVGAVLTSTAMVLTVLAPVGYRWVTIQMRERSVMVMQRRLLRLAATAPRLEHFERPDFQDRLEALKQGTHDLTMGLTLVTLGPLIVVDLVVTVVALARVVPILGLLPVVAVPAAMLSQRAEKIRQDVELRVATDRRVAADLFDLTSAAPSGREIRVYGLRGELLDRHRRAS